MTLYRIAKWNETYENNRSRLLKDLSFVLVPNSHDSEVYGYIMADRRAAQIFAAWILMLQVASRCQPRGTLIRQDGTPHDSASLAMRTRAPASWFDISIPFLADHGWLLRNELPDKDTALGCQIPAVGCHQSVSESKVREGKEENVGKTAVAVPTSLSLEVLKADPAYQGIDVEREHAKATVWCKAHRKVLTERRFVNWLNRCDKPIGPARVSDKFNRF